MQIQSNYNCTQQELYEVAKVGWRNYKNNLADFTNHKGRYTAALADTALEAILAAQNLPDGQACGAGSETLRIQLEQAADTCLNNWQILKSYIADSFLAEDQQQMLEAAGSNYYRQASGKSWPQMQSLLGFASKFINDNSEALSQGGNNMPATFPTKFATDKAVFQTTYTAFFASAVSGNSVTNAKITANNAVYESLIKMFADGQLIYKNDLVKKALFIFDTLLSYISAPGQAGLRIIAKEKTTELPVAGFSITIQPGNLRGATDSNGVLILSLPENTYSIIGIKDGYETFTEEVDIVTGIISRKNIELIKTA
ncbi:MAG TPA: hypothetical protein VH396_05720 [Chitinophagaceae bacterium]|jgi:hypothetical protein